MRFIYGKHDWATMDRAQENCYLLTNGLGGYSSQSLIGSNTRNDHALLMASTIAPNQRYHMVTNITEELLIQDKKHCLSSQEFVDFTKNQTGYRYLNQFFMEDYPTWIYQVEGVEMKKQMVMAYGENTLIIRYQVSNNGSGKINLTLTPHLQMVEKGKVLSKQAVFTHTEGAIESEGITLYYHTNGSIHPYATEFIHDLYYAYDARDGRDAIGVTAHNCKIHASVEPSEKKEVYVVFGLKPIDREIPVQQYFDAHIKRQNQLVALSELKGELARHLVKSADQYLVKRDSTNGETLMAGYPFFADWGRDTMISILGCCIATRRFEEAKSIFRTFMKYRYKGLMPNMFPEGVQEPLYNTVDASLLFIGAVYEYVKVSHDVLFINEALPVMEEIIRFYMDGTDYAIKMDSDGLIMAGSGLWQVTWMDVRYGDILPTPRHGKPVEINAYWYNALKITAYFSEQLNKSGEQYENLSQRVKQSFRDKFWNEREECLKDLVSGEPADEQVRCNQIWAISQPFSILEREMEHKVVKKVYETLYTPYGLRSLSKYDKDFKPIYSGSHYNRDMAYHQGTVWAFPLGGYYLAYLKVNEYSKAAREQVYEQLQVLEACMREGCIGQIAEIFDGDNSDISKGCFAQAWSVSELLRVFAKLEELDS